MVLYHMWRVQGVPMSFDRRTLAAALQKHPILRSPRVGGGNDDGNADNRATVRTLATALHHSDNQVATVHFSHLPQALEDLSRGAHLPVDLPIPAGSSTSYGNWKLDSLQSVRVTIDDNFDGLTVLHAPEHHGFDILAVSGLGNHAFASFVHKENGQMWLADNLYQDFPTARVIIYGQNTALQNSTSFAELDDLASSLHIALDQILRPEPRKPVILIGHSLGGLLIKEALIKLAEEEADASLLKMVTGCLFFGVPNDGMKIESLVPIVGDQPNRSLVQSLRSVNSQVLRMQKRNFFKVTEIAQIELFCFYETQLSPTAAETDGQYRMNGPLEYLVTQSSATSCLPPNSPAKCSIAIPRTHSDLVKFYQNDAEYRKVAHVLSQVSTHKVPSVSQSLGNLYHTAVTEAERDRLLRSLKFVRMEERKNMIDLSFPDTFKWIFSSRPDANCDFADWLKSDEKLYWISGKPGSGKSTLMNFIFHEPQTMKFLKPGTLVLFHCIWSAGSASSPMQHSIKGVLLALLYLLLVEEPSLLKLVFQQSKGVERKDQESDWPVHELKACLLATLAASTRPVFILLDGLDEISPSDGSSKLVNLLDEISRISCVKLCVASRSDPPFPEQYGSGPMLKLQDLTEDDIYKVCKEKLNSFKTKISDPTDEEFKDLAHSLHHKAEGVFLWVVLALANIEMNLPKGDSWEEIRRRIDILPPGLNELYQSMWKRANVDQGIYDQPPGYYLNLILEAGDMGIDLSLFDLILATDSKVRNAILNTEADPDAADLKNRCTLLEKRIMSRCAGMVELNHMSAGWEGLDSTKLDGLLPLTNLKVTFIHRTARDFLTHTVEGRHILDRDVTLLEERRVALLRAKIATLLNWRDNSLFSTSHLKNFVWDLQGLYYILSIILRMSRSLISEENVKMLLVLFGKIWHGRLLYASRIAPQIRIPNFIEKLALYGANSAFTAQLQALEASNNNMVSLNYKSYLLHQATSSAKELKSRGHEAMILLKSKIYLAQWLLQEGADPFWLGVRNWDQSFDVKPQVPFETSPIINMIMAGMSEISSIESGKVTISGQTYRYMRKCWETIWHMLEACPRPDHNALLVPMVIETNDSPYFFGTGLRFSFSVDFNFVSMLKRTPPFIWFVANTGFLLQLFSDLAALLSSRYQNNEDPTPRIRVLDSYWGRHECSAPLARLLLYRPPGPGQLLSCPLQPLFLDPEVLRKKIVVTIGYQMTGDMRSLIEAIGDLRSWVLEASEATGMKNVNSNSEIREQLEDYLLYSWPPSAEHPIDYPPPVFE